MEVLQPACYRTAKFHRNEHTPGELIFKSVQPNLDVGQRQGCARFAKILLVCACQEFVYCYIVVFVLVTDQCGTLFLLLPPMSKMFHQNKTNHTNINIPLAHATTKFQQNPWVCLFCLSFVGACTLSVTFQQNKHTPGLVLLKFSRFHFECSQTAHPGAKKPHLIFQLQFHFTSSLSLFIFLWLFATICESSSHKIVPNVAV